MPCLIDTTILGRPANVRDVQHAVAGRGVLELHRRGEVLHDWATTVCNNRYVCVGNGSGVSTLDADSGQVLWFSEGPNVCMLLAGELLLATGCLAEDAGFPCVLARSVKDGRTVFKTVL